MHGDSQHQKGMALVSLNRPLARTPHAMSSAKLPQLSPRIRKASLTQSDAKLYAMTQVISMHTYLTKDLHQSMDLQVTYAADMAHYLCSHSVP